MGFVNIEIYRENLTEIIDSLPGKFYLNGGDQLYYHSMKRRCTENKEGRMEVDWDDFKRSCTELSVDDVVDSLKDSQKVGFIISKFEESPLEYSNLIKSIS